MGQVLKEMISASDLAIRVQELGNEISRDYNGEEVVVISVLKGSFIFAADLIREMTVPLSTEFIAVSSYEGTESTGHVRIVNDLSSEIKGKNILIVEDIVDTGKTLDYLLNMFKAREPKSIKVCALLSKPDVHSMHAKVDYYGFNIKNEFVVGYGLDLDGRFREIPYLAILNND